MPELDWSGNQIYLDIKSDWKTPELLIEGSLNCAKTTIGLDKEIDALLKWPGIPILLFRWTEDAVKTKLKPAFDELLSIRGITAEWDANQKVYTFDNGSKAWMFGLKAVSQIEMFNKIRGLGVCRIFGDQVEEMDRAVAGELRGRLRPNLTATLSGRRFPFQLTFVANPEDHDFWLSKEFPLDNHIKGRKMYSLSIFDNYHAPAESRESLLRQYPEDHPKNLTMVQGRRGPNIIGDAVFEGLYRRDLHWRAVELRRDAPVLESVTVGKHNPTWLIAQKLQSDGIAVLGGVIGEGLALEDFLATIDEYRRAWIPRGIAIQSCVAPMGQSGGRFTPLDLIRKKIPNVKYEQNGNAADVRLAMIEVIASYLRRRNVHGEECLAVNNDEQKFIVVTDEGVRPSAFMHHAFEGGFVYDEHFTSIDNKELKQAREDDKFSNAMDCLENICLNFCVKYQPKGDAGWSKPPLLSARDWMGV